MCRKLITQVRQKLRSRIKLLIDTSRLEEPKEEVVLQEPQGWVTQEKLEPWQASS